MEERWIAVVFALCAGCASCQSYVGALREICRAHEQCSGCAADDFDAALRDVATRVVQPEAADLLRSLLKQDDHSRVLMLRREAEEAGLGQCPLAEAIEAKRPKVGVLGAVTRELAWIEGRLLLAADGLTWGDDRYEARGAVLRATAFAGQVWALTQEDLVADWWIARSGEPLVQVDVGIKPAEVQADARGPVIVGSDQRTATQRGWAKALSPEGEPLWEVSLGTGVLLELALTPDAAIVAGTRKNDLWLAALDRETGSLSWERIVVVGEDGSRPGELWWGRKDFTVVGEGSLPRRRPDPYVLTFTADGDVGAPRRLGGEWGRVEAAVELHGEIWVVGRDVREGGNDREGPFVGAVGRVTDDGVEWRRTPECLPARFVTTDGEQLWMGGDAHGSSLAGWYTPFNPEAFEGWRPICSTWASE